MNTDINSENRKK